VIFFPEPGVFRFPNQIKKHFMLHVAGIFSEKVNLVKPLGVHPVDYGAEDWHLAGQV
jgi:hypothetical protein